MQRIFFRSAILAFLAIQLIGPASSAQTVLPAQVMPEPNAPITAARSRARDLFKSLTGVAISIDDPRLKQMEILIQSGRDREAAAVATGDPLFYNIRVRDMARKMSNREETVRVSTNDFVATFVGIVRDSDTVSAKAMLTGNFVYRADPNKMTNAQSELNDMILSNNHYIAIDAGNYSLKDVLIKVDGQKTMLVGGTTGGAPKTATGNLGAHPDPAGLLTTRQWVAAHALNGTNRRMVEFTFRQFMCQPISQWADINQPMDHIGRDVDRAPGGDPNKFMNTCRGCHSLQDGLRGAFSHVDYNDGQGQPLYFQSKIADKYSRNSTTFPGGYVTKDDSFVNYINSAKNQDSFGWNGMMEGRGMNQLGAMIANSQGFSRCMVRRVFSAVCKRDANPKDESLIRKLADDFEQDGYHMRRLFETVALRPECTGMM